jgi:hypothetical protein
VHSIRLLSQSVEIPDAIAADSCGTALTVARAVVPDAKG